MITHLQHTLKVFLSLMPRDLPVIEETRDLLELLDSRDFLDPRVLLVRLASPESRY